MLNIEDLKEGDSIIINCSVKKVKGSFVTVGTDTNDQKLCIHKDNVLSTVGDYVDLLTDYSKGTTDMYHAIKRIVGTGSKYDIQPDDLIELFGSTSIDSIMDKYNDEEILFKIHQYEVNETDISEGDQVFLTSHNNQLCIVIDITKDDNGNIVFIGLIGMYNYKPYLLTFSDQIKPKDKLRKTGKKYTLNFLDNLEEDKENA